MSLSLPFRRHQQIAVDRASRELTLGPGQKVPPQGLRAQIVSPTGSGKTLMAVGVADELATARNLVLVPNLDLLLQTATEWRAAGFIQRMLGLCSLRTYDPALLSACTTDPDELADRTHALDEYTLFATYQSVGMGTLQRAHEAGLPTFSLMVVDEAHRVSGAAGKPWAAVLDNVRIPSDRRLFLTATPRVWELGSADKETGDEDTAPGRGSGSGRSGVRLIASMDDVTQFGKRVFDMGLGEAVDEGHIAPFRIVCQEISDPAYQEAIARGEGPRSDHVRALRLAAVQAATLRIANQYELSRVLTFHARVAEARAFAEGLPDAARKAAAGGNNLDRLPQGLAARWLHGEHDPQYRAQVLRDFHAGITDAGKPVERSFLSSVKVLGVGVDTWADAVIMCDVYGSMPDIIQTLGRALRMRPGDGKVATIVVPIFLGPGESTDQMITSPAYDDLARFMEALRAHDAKAVEILAASALEPAPAKPTPASVESADEEGTQDSQDAIEGDSDGAEGDPVPGLLNFTSAHTRSQIARFINLRVLQPERYAWLRGLEASRTYREAHRDLRVPYDYRDADNLPLGVWIADQRRARKTGRLAPDRTDALDALGMLWSQYDAAFEDALTACRAYRTAHDHLLPPVDTIEPTTTYPVGRWLRDQRRAARAGTLAADRCEALDEIDPSWRPLWPVDWQRAFHQARTHLDAGGTLTGHAPGRLVIGDDDIGRWIEAQVQQWHTLQTTQRWMLEHVLRLSPPATGRRVKTARVSQADKRARNLAAARAYHLREGHLAVPRTHTEIVDGESIKLGVFVNNARTRQATLAPELAAELTALGMRWS
ncbi:DEAD/DEAH box helicase [Streptomyces sp. H39-S7]|uniref:DEAD/DEAH box helicase n=1 Tax=Streptomyces sp. H39-S7 TaxID=3004357 RepID=UPI0022AEBB4D|nr:DEAD/DEAH box helicase [Streptomyces sp. H39-S7]MCZ4120280.1 Helicase associated domain protein [Streptomyces sp. H39-S7]